MGPAEKMTKMSENQYKPRGKGQRRGGPSQKEQGLCSSLTEDTRQEKDRELRGLMMGRISRGGRCVFTSIRLPGPLRNPTSWVVSWAVLVFWMCVCVCLSWGCAHTHWLSQESLRDSWRWQGLQVQSTVGLCPSSRCHFPLQHFCLFCVLFFPQRHRIFSLRQSTYIGLKILLFYPSPFPQGKMPI